MNAEQIDNLEVIDGYVYDTTTGECMGLATPPAFQIHDADTLDWAMGKLLQTETAIAAIDSSETVLHAKTILANAEKMKKPLHARLEWLHTRFDNEIAHYVKPLLEGQKTKTYRTLYGTVGFRKVPGGLRVKDPVAALGLAKRFYPEAVKVSETFQISALSPEHREHIEQGLETWEVGDEARTAFLIQEDEERVSIKTGLEK